MMVEIQLTHDEKEFLSKVNTFSDHSGLYIRNRVQKIHTPDKEACFSLSVSSAAALPI